MGKVICHDDGVRSELSVIQIYEKELAERTRRFIVIKKMRGRRYLETHLMLDRNKLF